MMNKISGKELLCTLGPASREQYVISRLEDIGVSLFRINLSHTKVEHLDKVIEDLKSITNVPICLDTEGAQIRTGDLNEGKIFVEENDVIRITNALIKGDKERFNLYPHEVVDLLKVGDLLSIDFNSVLVQVIQKDNEGALIRVLTGGLLGQNKGVSLDRNIYLSPLTEKDKKAIAIGMKHNLKHVALSFANRASDVEQLKELVGEDVFLISKIESIEAIENLKEIAGRSNAILLDRGDLSREVPIEEIPRAQKEIIRRSKEYGSKVYVATNLLESMIEAPNPTRAEVNDVFNTIVDGADGLVLAAETAIGSYPIQCAEMVSKIINQFNKFNNGSKFSTKYLKTRHSLLQIDPHGGKLINRILSDADWDEINSYKKLKVKESDLLNAEQIAIGTFSPLEGFMTKLELESVIYDYTLSDGVIWPLPITLQIAKSQADKLSKGEKIALCLDKDEQVYAFLEIEDIYQYDIDKIAKEVFATSDSKHPGVKFLKNSGETFLGGRIQMINRLPSKYKYYEITPHQTRRIFDNKGWSRIVGFHTRNVAHRAHEFIQMEAFKKHQCDGIFIHPLIGPKKTGDYHPEIILKSYEFLTKKYFPKDEVVLAAFQSYPRYSGPREAVFTAICRKNFGCSHFIVEREHSGVGNFYEPDSSHKLLDRLGDIGIVPIYFN